MRDNPQFILFFVIVGLHILASCISNSLSYSQLASLRLHLATQDWEDEGEIYHRFFRIRKWKDHVPTAGPFDKSRLRSLEGDYLSLFILETVRAEVAHTLCLASCCLALLVYTKPYSICIPLFFTLINLPCIMIQRYNRPRLERVLKRRGTPLSIPQTQVVRRWRILPRR